MTEQGNRYPLFSWQAGLVFCIFGGVGLFIGILLAVGLDALGDCS